MDKKYIEDRKFILESLMRLEQITTSLVNTTVRLDKRVDRVYLTAAGIASFLGTITAGLMVIALQALVTPKAAVVVPLAPKVSVKAPVAKPEPWADLIHPCDTTPDLLKCEIVYDLFEEKEEVQSI